MKQPPDQASRAGQTVEGNVNMDIVAHTTPKPRYWRLRQCPTCRKVMPAGEIEWLWSDDYWAPWTNGKQNRLYPICGFIGHTSDFAVVREIHPEQRQRGGGAA